MKNKKYKPLLIANRIDTNELKIRFIAVWRDLNKYLTKLKQHKNRNLKLYLSQKITTYSSEIYNC